MSDTYRALEARFKRLFDIGGGLAILHWDRQTMMPAGGNAARAEQIATLRQIAHELLTGPETGELLDRAEQTAGDLDRWQAANLREMRRSYRHASALAPELVAALARATTKAEMIWRDARAKDDFATLRPALEEALDLTREEAAAKSEALGLAPYDALLAGYEPGITTAEIDALFEPLAAFLPDFIERVLARQSEPLALEGRFPTDRQKALGQHLMTALGFDFDHGRLDESLHPFCGGVPDDVRMTARYVETDVASGLMAILHETGHALYNAGLPTAWRHQPVGRPCSFAVHESQSLLIEMQVCRSRPFLEYLAPLLAEAFGVDGAAFAPENLYRRAIRVERSLIRVDADEVTYPLHIVLRYRLEKALLSG
ncbi:MAG: carboxypeptidase M32, partial [Geminicoccales bacterium]